MGASIGQIFEMSLSEKTIHKDDTIADAVRKMEESGARGLLVLDQNENGIGVLSEHDVVTAFAAQGDAAKDQPVSKYMTLDLIVAEDQADLDYVIKLMAMHNIRHMPVVSAAGRVVSFLSIMQILVAKVEG